MEQLLSAPSSSSQLDTTVAASSATLSPPHSPSHSTEQQQQDPGSPTGQLHSAYHEFRARIRAREDAAAAAAVPIVPPPPPVDPLAPIVILADQPDAQLLAPVQPFYSSALLEPTLRTQAVASGGSTRKSTSSTRSSNNMQQQHQTASATTSTSDSFTATPRRPLSASAKKPSGSFSSAASITPRSASTKSSSKAGGGGGGGNVTRSTALSEARKQGVADRKESMRIAKANDALPDALDMKNRPTTPATQRKFPFLQKSTGAAAGVGSAANGRAATPTQGLTSNGHASATTEQQNGSTTAAAPSKPTPSNTKRPVRTALAPAFAASSASGSKKSSSSSASHTDFSALKKKKQGSFEPSFEVLVDDNAPGAGKKVTIQEPAETEDNKQETDDADSESTALTTTEQPPHRDGNGDPTPLSEEELAAMLAPRPSQVLATLGTPTPYFPTATPIRTALIPQSLALSNLPASSSKKVPLSLAGRTGLAHECASCHELHLRVDKQNLEIHRLSECVQKLEHVRLQAEQLGREKAARNMELDSLTTKLAKSEARCATLSNQLTTLRIEQDKSMKLMLAAQEEKLLRAAKESADKSIAAAQAESLAAQKERDEVVLEKKGLVAKLSHIAQAKRALEKSLASLEGSYKTLQEHHEVLLRQKLAAETTANNTERIVNAQEEDADLVRTERARLTSEVNQARSERDAFEREAQALRSELSAFQSLQAQQEEALQAQEAVHALYTDSQTALESSHQNVQSLTARTHDLEGQVKFERDQVRVLRNDLARAQQALEAAGQKESPQAARANERADIESSYVTEIAAVRQEIAQLQREKAQVLEENSRMRKQMENMTRTQHLQQQQQQYASSGAAGGTSGGYQQSSFAASPFAASPRGYQPQHQQQQQQSHQQMFSPQSPSSAYDMTQHRPVDMEDEEEEQARPTSAPAQPAARPSSSQQQRSSLTTPAGKSKIPSSAAVRSASKERTTPGTTGASGMLETPSPRPRIGSPLPSPHPKAGGTAAPASATTSTRKPLYTPRTPSTTVAASASASASSAQPRSGSISNRVQSPTALTVAARFTKTSASVSPASTSTGASIRAKSVSPSTRSSVAPGRTGAGTGIARGASGPASSASATKVTPQREPASQSLSAFSDAHGSVGGNVGHEEDQNAEEGESMPASASASVSGSITDDATFSQQVNNYLRASESSSSPAMAPSSSFAPASNFLANSGGSGGGGGLSHSLDDPASTARMLASLQSYKGGANLQTTQSLLVLEGLIQQAGILRAKMAEKQSALTKLIGAAGSSSAADASATKSAADRLRAESRVLSQTLDLTKDNIRSQYAALQASLGHGSTEPVSSSGAFAATSTTPWNPSPAATVSTTTPLTQSFRPSFTWASPPSVQQTQQPPASTSRFGAWNATLPLTQTSPSPALRNSGGNTGLFSPPLSAPPTATGAPARFVPAASFAAAFFQQPAASAFVNRSFAPSAFAPASSSASPAPTLSNSAPPTAASSSGVPSLSGPFSTTFQGGSSLAVNGMVPHAQTQAGSGNLVSAAGSGVGGGGSTFNLQVSKDAKNIYITHSSMPITAAAGGQQQHQQQQWMQSPSPSTVASSSSFQPRPALLSAAPFNSPAPASSSVSSSSLSAPSVAASPFLSPAAPSASSGPQQLRPMHAHATFHYTSPMPISGGGIPPGGGVNNASSFLSPVGASTFAARTPATVPRPP